MQGDYMRIRKISLLLTAACVFVVSGRAGIIYNESTSGDLANVGTAPTFISFSSGSNEVIGTTGRASSTAAIDRDYFTFTVPVGLELVSITPLPGTQVNGLTSFIGLQSGTTLSVPPTATDATGLLGWWHYSTADIGQDILSKMAIPAMGSSGFATPLGPGPYSVWVQDFSVPSVNYAFGLELQAIPEPGTFAPFAFVVAATTVWLRFRRRTRRI
jgi:hypothetical protein